MKKSNIINHFYSSYVNHTKKNTPDFRQWQQGSDCSADGAPIYCSIYAGTTTGLLDRRLLNRNSNFICKLCPVCSLTDNDLYISGVGGSWVLWSVSIRKLERVSNYYWQTTHLSKATHLNFSKFFIFSINVTQSPLIKLNW